ncbi:hypothetical protein FCU45_06310 [Sulfurimonas crateris]|uniref:Uncharacterized protein n=1 Tax=Sulfurimonas crateris TaxID=2574727 RepID=A0A4U2Z642_9BACT|nr:hypothetical protein [Sulfurimonas crateris]TKI69668.1 hypothetical protein FCU45_06310 [Sulfurimonas crateris]
MKKILLTVALFTTLSIAEESFQAHEQKMQQMQKESGSGEMNQDRNRNKEKQEKKSQYKYENQYKNGAQDGSNMNSGSMGSRGGGRR